MSCYAVIDTNVLVSSLLAKRSDSAPAFLLVAVLSGEIIPLYNPEILAEYKEVLNRPKFPFSTDRSEKLLWIIRQFGVSVDPTLTGMELPDMSDLVFYEVMMEKREDDAYLVTGNLRHFPVRTYIVTPAEMMALIRGKAAP